MLTYNIVLNFKMQHIIILCPHRLYNMQHELYVAANAKDLVKFSPSIVQHNTQIRFAVITLASISSLPSPTLSFKPKLTGKLRFHFSNYKLLLKHEKL